MKLRLFAIRSLTTGKLIPDTYFALKADAKGERNKLGPDTHVVTNGPDHRKYRS